jgi:beta-lactamase regulating signal transducer with metallopeptidase domain
MLSWLILTTLETSLLIGVVLLARPLIRRAFGANVACALWLIPAIGAVLPTRPPRPESLLETIRLPGGEIPQLYSSAETLELPTGLPWEMLWLAGVGIWLLVQVARSARFRRSLRSTAAPFVTNAPSLVELLNRYGLSQARVFTTTRSGAPFVTGLFTAKVFLPADFSERFSEPEQRWILIHELTHVRRRDLLVRLVAEGFRSLFWFNPLTHLAVHLLHQDQEYACDQAVVSRCTGQERYQYGRALMLGASPKGQPSFLTFFHNGKERYVMLGKHRSSTLSTLVGASVCVLIGVYSLTSAPYSVAQNATAPAYDFGSMTQLNAEVHQAKWHQGTATLVVLAPDQSGKPQEWTVTLPPPSELREAGINIGFFAPGHGYVITGNRSIDPKEHRLLAVTITRPDGSVWVR